MSRREPRTERKAPQPSQGSLDDRGMDPSIPEWHSPPAPAQQPSWRADNRSWFALQWDYYSSQFMGFFTHYGARESEQALDTWDRLAAERRATPLNRLFHGFAKPVAQGFVSGATQLEHLPFQLGHLALHPIASTQGVVQGLYIQRPASRLNTEVGGLEGRS